MLIYVIVVKCNLDFMFFKLLVVFGNGFDCVFKVEIEQVFCMGVDFFCIIYVQFCKINLYVCYVVQQGVCVMIFDNVDEFCKIVCFYFEVEFYLCIFIDDMLFFCCFSMKFGVLFDLIDGFLVLVCDLNFNVVGVSFYVGFGVLDFSVFLKVVCDFYMVFQQVVFYGFLFKILDVGGGFCVDNIFEQMVGVFCEVFDEYFFVYSGINLIVEFGCFYVLVVYILVCNVIVCCIIQDIVLINNGIMIFDFSYMLYVNDGLYGNFSSIMFDYQYFEVKVFCVGGQILYDIFVVNGMDDCSGVEYSIWGLICDGIDCIIESICFFVVLDVGDWFYFEDMGVYIKCFVIIFNGFFNEYDVIYVCSEFGVKVFLDL